MQGLIDLVQKGYFPTGSRILYAHLGGVPPSTPTAPSTATADFLHGGLPCPSNASAPTSKVVLGVDIYYEDVGKGVPLVLIPGWTFTTRVFDHQFAAFSGSHRVIAFDPAATGARP